MEGEQQRILGPLSLPTKLSMAPIFCDIESGYPIPLERHGRKAVIKASAPD